MAGILLAQAEAQLTQWLAADAAVARRQSYTIGDRSMSSANAKEILENIKYWEKRVIALSGGGMRVRGVTPCE